ncbi:Ribonuclease E [compost metagenome]
MHVIDVNSGTRAADSNQEESALKTNLEAAEEIARQLRLRDLGGIIIIDFIDLKLPENRKILHDAMSKFMTKDRARNTVLPISKFGLMQLTRQRLRPEININTTEVCPTCKGSGKIEPSILITDEVAKDVQYLINQGHKNLAIMCHPMLQSYIKYGGFWKSLQWKWYRKHKIWLKIKPNNDFPITQYKFIDTQTDDFIKL